MSNVKLYSADEVCKELNVTTFTLKNWYRWQRNLIKDGKVKEEYLPKPIRLEHQKGKPNRWTKDMIKQLIAYQKTIVFGRHGLYGMYSNPYHKETKKYKEENTEA